MKEWTDSELVAEMLSEGKFEEIEGHMEPMVSFNNLKRIVFDTRFPDVKSNKATDLVIKLQQHFDNFKKEKHEN